MSLEKYFKILTFQHWAQLRHEGHPAGTQVLPDGNLLEEDGDAAKGHGHEVHEQESAWLRRKKKKCVHYHFVGIFGTGAKDVSA